MSQNAIDVIKLELTLSEGNTIPKCNANATPVSAKKFVIARISLFDRVVKFIRGANVPWKKI